MSGTKEHVVALALAQRKTPVQFLDRARAIHGDKYEYPDLSDVRARSRIRIICPDHGEFSQTVTNHINIKTGCPVCARNSRDYTAMAKMPKMKNRITLDEWKRRIAEVHGDKFTYPDFDKPDYSPTVRELIRVVCPIHGESLQLLSNHLRGCGCEACGSINSASNRPTNLRTAEIFLMNAREVHGDKYEYPDLSNVRSETEIRIVCPEHGEFTQKVKNHLTGRGCGVCSRIENSMIGKLSSDEMMERIKNSQGERFDLYEYPSLDGLNTKDRITVHCKRHNYDFNPAIQDLMRGGGCPKCAIGIEPLDIDPRNIMKDGKKLYRLTWEIFMERTTLIHGDRYTYERPSAWKGLDTKIQIKCPLHGSFIQSVEIHLRGSGCPRCKASKGERLIGSIMEKSGIHYDFQKTFDGLVGAGNKPLRYDFYVPMCDLIIEYDGLHHFEPVSYGTTDAQGAIRKFEKMNNADRIKQEYAQANGLRIIRFGEESSEEFILEELAKFGITVP